MPRQAKILKKKIKDKLLVESMHRCCLCPEHAVAMDIHHIVPISENGPNTEDNLMVICANCHAKIHRIRGRYSPKQLKMYKNLWIELCWNKESLIKEKIRKEQTEKNGSEQTYPPLRITRLKLNNIKCFKSLDLSFIDNQNQSRLWTIILGDNSVGKSTILQCIALCAIGHDQALKLPVSPKNMLYLGADDGFIEATFNAPINPSNIREEKSNINIKLVIKRGWDFFRIEKKGDIYNIESLEEYIHLRNTNFNGWFIAGYGATRNLFLLDKPARIGEENPIVNRVESLFNPYKMLIDIPSLTRLLQGDTSLYVEMGAPPVLPIQTTNHINELLNKLLSIFSYEVPLDKEKFMILLRKIPLSELSDGYKSILSWFGHLIMHLLKAIKWDGDLKDVKGIVLLDEIDLHLHPKWQRKIIGVLKNAFPKIQFICTTHSPITVGGADNGEIILLEQKNGIIENKCDLPSIQGWRVDQVVTSILFDLPTSRNIHTEKLFKEYAEKLNLRGPEDEEVKDLGTKVSHVLKIEGEGQIDVKTYELLDELLRKKFQSLDAEKRKLVLAKAGLIITD